jgi:hypothetical protein
MLESEACEKSTQEFREAFVDGMQDLIGEPIDEDLLDRIRARAHDIADAPTFHIWPPLADRQVDTDAPCVVFDNDTDCDVKIGDRYHVDAPRIRIDFGHDINHAPEADYVPVCSMVCYVPGKYKGNSVLVYIKGSKKDAVWMAMDIRQQLNERHQKYLGEEDGR